MGVLPPLAEDSGRNWKADPDEISYDSQENVKTRVHGAEDGPAPYVPPSSTSTTEPRGVPVLTGGSIPTIYYVLAVLAVVLIVSIAWLIAR